MGPVDGRRGAGGVWAGCRAEVMEGLGGLEPSAHGQWLVLGLVTQCSEQHLLECRCLAMQYEYVGMQNPRRDESFSSQLAAQEVAVPQAVVPAESCSFSSRLAGALQRADQLPARESRVVQASVGRCSWPTSSRPASPGRPTRPCSGD